jgi:C4-dicarboxylate transporter DctM subunit
MSIPFFILTANIMSQGGISERLIKFANSLVGFFPGGLGMTAVVACLFFGAISGSAPATVVAVGAIIYPALLSKKYGEDFSIGVISSSGALGIIIPPSITMIVYGAVTGTSVGTLFVAGFGAGTIFAVLFMIYSFWYAKTRKPAIVQTERPSIREIVKAVKDSMWGIGIPVIIIGGIYGGVFTPTEAAGVSVVYSIFVAMVVYRKLDFQKFFNVVVDSAVLTASVMIILASASVFAWVLTTSGLTTDITSSLVSVSDNPLMILLCINIAVLIAGMFLDGASIITILGPLLYPIALKYKIDPIHLGVIINVNCAIGMFTPPFGLNLFVASGVAKLPIMRVAKAVMPFIVISIGSLLLITYFPDISLWLPRLVYGSW